MGICFAFFRTSVSANWQPDKTVAARTENAGGCLVRCIESLVFLFAFDGLDAVLSHNRDHPGFLFFRNFTDKVDRQQTFPHFRVNDLDMVCQTERPLERAGGDAAMQVGDTFLGLFLDLAAYQQGLALCRNAQIVKGEPGHRHNDAVFILASLFDVVRRIGVEPFLSSLDQRFKQIVESVKSNSLTH
jgi:hypothetical protein